MYGILEAGLLEMPVELTSLACWCTRQLSLLQQLFLGWLNIVTHIFGVSKHQLAYANRPSAFLEQAKILLSICKARSTHSEVNA